MNYGFINDREQDKDAWVFGSGQLQSDILQPDGQWDAYLPPDEFQYRGFETYACATFGTFHAIETILRRRFTEIEDYSDRYTAKLTGTDQKHGNSPHYIAEWIRQNGAVFEEDWAFDSSVTTFDQFYEAAPRLPDKLLPEFAFNHDYVDSTPEAMKEALKYSPLGISVFGWAIDDFSGYYYVPEGQSDNHWCVCYGYEDGQYWKIFDSYDNSHKKLRWDTKSEMIKRYHIDRTPASRQQLSRLQQLLQNALNQIALLRAKIGL